MSVSKDYPKLNIYKCITADRVFHGVRDGRLFIYKTMTGNGEAFEIDAYGNRHPTNCRVAPLIPGCYKLMFYNSTTDTWFDLVARINISNTGYKYLYLVGDFLVIKHKMEINELYYVMKLGSLEYTTYIHHRDEWRVDTQKIKINAFNIFNDFAKWPYWSACPAPEILTELYLAKRSLKMPCMGSGDIEKFVTMPMKIRGWPTDTVIITAGVY